MNRTNLTNQSVQTAWGLYFCVLCFVEILVYGFILYTSMAITNTTPSASLSIGIVFGNFFLIKGIVCNKPDNILLFPIIYSYKLIITIYFARIDTGFGFVLRSIHLAIFVVFLVSAGYVYFSFKRLFAFYYFKKIGSDPFILCKCSF